MRFEFSRYREFGFGLALGLSLSALVLVWQNYREKNATALSAETPKPEPRSDKSAAVGDAEDGPKNYDFYDMLPKFEMVVPEKDHEVSRERDTARAQIERPGVYVLQAGSYRKQEEADRIQALLKKQGIDANVQRVSVDDDVWHRVRIGPISDLAELNRMRARLRAAEFDDVLVIRVGD
ncbi:MAG: SPOR domain-containing protein [Pseudomonadota bacterium]